MEIVWRASALNDLEAIREFIAQDNPSAAARILTAIRVAVDRLGRHPEPAESAGWKGPEN
jgi:plasmid stabilization system protein ParE